MTFDTFLQYIVVSSAMLRVVQDEEEKRNGLDQDSLRLLNDISSKEKETSDESNRYASLTRDLDDKR